MFKATELLGLMLQSDLWNAAAARLRHAMGPEGLGWFEEVAGQPSGVEGAGFGGTRGGLAEPAPDFIGPDRLGERAGRVATAAPAGSPFEGPSGHRAIALLSGLAYSALGQQARPATGQPAGARPPEDAADPEQLEQSATLILAAMINAAKADGQIDQEELQRIVGKLREAGADADALDFVMSELRKPLDLEGLIRKVPNERVAMQLYAASLLAIDVDTDAERRYLRRLAHGLGLDPGAVRRVHECLGMRPA